MGLRAKRKRDAKKARKAQLAAQRAVRPMLPKEHRDLWTEFMLGHRRAIALTPSAAIRKNRNIEQRWAIGLRSRGYYSRQARRARPIHEAL